MIDIDHFKRVNDDCGHLGGDFALRELAACVSKCIRREDLFARYGGEEFGMVLVETELDQARQTADRVREVVAGHAVSFDDKSVRLTVSLGIAVTCGDPSMTVARLLRQADAQLYRAKAEGRNRVSG
jgi:two-component system, cell cycle response regulator